MNISYRQLQPTGEDLGLTQMEGATQGHATSAGLWLKLELFMPSRVLLATAKKSWELVKIAMHIGVMRVILWTSLFTYTVIKFTLLFLIDEKECKL